MNMFLLERLFHSDGKNHGIVWTWEDEAGEWFTDNLEEIPGLRCTCLKHDEEELWHVMPLEWMEEFVQKLNPLWKVDAEGEVYTIIDAPKPIKSIKGWVYHK